MWRFNWWLAFAAIAVLVILFSAVAIGETLPLEPRGRCTLAGARNLIVINNYAYVACGVSGLKIINVQAPDSPFTIGTYQTGGDVYDVVVKDSLALLADDYMGLFIINISNPAEPSLVGAIELPGSRCIDYRGNYAYISSVSDSSYAVDFSDPSNPLLVSNFLTAGEAIDTEIKNDILYLLAEDTAPYRTELSSFGLADPEYPTLLGQAADSSFFWCQALALGEDFAYIFACNYRLDIYDITDPTNPFYVHYSTINGNLGDVDIWRRYAFVGTNSSALNVKDVYDPHNPLSVYGITTDGPVSGVCFDNKYVYITTSITFQIFRFHEYIYSYIPGDANGNGSFNGIDVGFTVNYLKTGVAQFPTQPLCPYPDTLYAAADANGSCALNGLDITYSINYLKGQGPAATFCPECPPEP